MKFKILLFISIILVSCNPEFDEPIGEDYNELFPFDGIDVPDVSYEEMKSRLCNPELPLDNYEYPGVTIPDSNREYTVTLKCKFNEGENYSSRYIIRYVDADRKLRVLGSNKQDISLSGYLNDNQEKIITFDVKSGFPMYLAVDGVGARNSSIKASISAVSKDGYINTPILISEQNQNKEGPNRVPEPYCEYIILP